MLISCHVNMGMKLYKNSRGRVGVNFILILIFFFFEHTSVIMEINY